MGETTAISWAHHTFNPWEGCTRISPACDNCYAADRAHRFGNDHLWAGELRRTSKSNWRQPLKWNREAEAAGEQRRVFCASLADVFDNQAPQEWRDDLWRLIEATPHLTWMLLTKRPQIIARGMPELWRRAPGMAPKNVWIGFTAEDQERLNQRAFATIFIAKHTGWLPFCSAEPLLGPLDPTRVAIPGHQTGRFNLLTGVVAECAIVGGNLVGLDDYPPLGLMITGGESGRNARPSHPDWFRRLRDDCAAAGVPYHFKQWGEWAPSHDEVLGDLRFVHRFDDAVRVGRFGSGCAGRHLDGVEHLAMPS